MATLLERYLEGDHDAVWSELRQLGSGVRKPGTLEDARGVVAEAIGRARENVQRMVFRLREQDYRFAAEDPKRELGATAIVAPPDARTPEFVAWLEKRFGPLPLTARAWIELVGDVDLSGTHPKLPPDLVTDPLVIEFENKSWAGAKEDRANFARTHFENEHEVWEEDEPRGPFFLDVAPDALHKANISGGAPYGVIVPDASADATFRFDDGVLLPFIEYLRLTFRHGGLTGLWRRGGDSRDMWRLRSSLAEGLLEL